MAEPKHGRKPRPAEDEDAPEPLEAGLRGPSYERVEDLDAEPDEYLLMKVVEANGSHHRTMRVGLGLGTLALVGHVTVGPYLYGDAIGPNLAAFVVIGGLLGAGLHALQRQLELLRRAVAATDHFVFGPPQEHDHAHK